MTGQRMRPGGGGLLYCSGPISGIEPAARDAVFEKSREWARANDWRPVLPLELPPYEHAGPCPRGRGGAMGGQGGVMQTHNEACYLRNDYKALAQCDGILMAPGWRASWGCKHELMMAADIGLRILFWNRNGAVMEVD